MFQNWEKACMGSLNLRRGTRVKTILSRDKETLEAVIKPSWRWVSPVICRNLETTWIRARAMLSNQDKTMNQTRNGEKCKIYRKRAEALKWNVPGDKTEVSVEAGKDFRIPLRWIFSTKFPFSANVSSSVFLFVFNLSKSKCWFQPSNSCSSENDFHLF